MNNNLIEKMINYLLNHGLSKADSESVRKDLSQMEQTALLKHQTFEEYIGKDYREFCDDLLEVGYDISRPKHQVKTIQAKKSKLSMIFASVFIMIPPLALGLMSIYERHNMSSSSQSILYDGILLMIAAFVYIGIIMSGEKKILDHKGIKWILFGITSHIIIFLFIFQSQLNIEEFIDVYVTTLGLMTLYFLLIDRRKVNIELLLFAIVYLSFYKFHIFFVFDTTYSGVIEHPIIPWWTYAFYLYIIPIFTVSVYAIKMVNLKVNDPFIYIFILLSVFSLMILSEYTDQRTLLTIYLIMPFVIIIDFVVSKVNKRSNPMKLPFYLRLIVLDIFVVIFKSSYSYREVFIRETLYMYTFMMIATLLISVIEHFIKEKIADKNND